MHSTFTAPAKLLWSAKETAAALSISQSGLWNLTFPRGPIPVCKLGNRRLYRVADIERAIDRLTQGADDAETT